MNKYNYIQVTTNDKFKLNGLYKSGENSKSAVIMIHGFTSDFYSHKFYHSIAEKLSKQGNAVILAQTRGTGIVTEFLKTDGSGEDIGSYYEKIEEAHLDITAFIKFLLNEGYSEIILTGHSLGTIKSIRYLFEGEYKDKIKKLVLLAPFDKNAFMEVKAPKKWQEFVEIAKQKIIEGKGREIVPVPEYEDFAMSYQTFYSWYVQDDLSCIWDFYRKNYDFPVIKKINIPTKVIIGNKDAFISYPGFGTTTESCMKIMKKNIKDCETVIIGGSEHCYIGFEDLVADEVAKFV
jgi:predicted alpha/beta-fold hydrolase